MIKTDVLVIGAGPAGSTAARFAAKEAMYKALSPFIKDEYKYTDYDTLCKSSQDFVVKFVKINNTIFAQGSDHFTFDEKTKGCNGLEHEVIYCFNKDEFLAAKNNKIFGFRKGKDSLQGAFLKIKEFCFFILIHGPLNKTFKTIHSLR